MDCSPRPIFNNETLKLNFHSVELAVATRRHKICRMYTPSRTKKSFIAVIFLTAATIIASLSYTEVLDLSRVVHEFYQSVSCNQTWTCITTNLKTWAAGGKLGYLFRTSTNSTSSQTLNMTITAEGFNVSMLTSNASRNHIDLSQDLVNTDIISTTMTFDPKLVVRCKMSPYIDCFPSSTKNTVTNMKNQTFNIAFLRDPGWISLNFTACNYNNCFSHGTRVTEQTHVVLVYGIGLRDSFKPGQRWKHQRYALAVWESPVHTNSEIVSRKDSIWTKQFNMTISYRVDSDVFVPYFKLKFNPKPLEKRPDYYKIATNKTKTAVWLVSHCGSHSGRDNYVHEMQKYIDVDTFGKCGQPCQKNSYSCLTDLPLVYKFYLAFENSFCTDYVTEKFFNKFVPGMHVIPVVRGGADYDKYFANFTYINAAHFKTAKDLALYLKDLAADVRTYSKYLEYKDLYEISGFDISKMNCPLCEYLNTEEQVSKVYEWPWSMQHCHKLNDIQ